MFLWRKKAESPIAYSMSAREYQDSTCDPSRPEKDGVKEMDWTQRSVLVTGGTDFIGSNLVDGLLEMGTKVVVERELG